MQVRDVIEEPVAGSSETYTGEQLLCSVAISLKRIADTLAPESGQDVGTTLWYIEQLKRGRIDP